MKKLIIASMMLALLGSVRAQNTFNVVAMNVDGLPNTILGIDLNPDGPGAAGTLNISQKLATMGYDIIGVSEDFNYNNELMQYMTNFSCGTFRGGVSMNNYRADISFNTDGLNLLWRQGIVASNEHMYGWNQKYGKFNNGADELIDKGFRFYQVTINDSVTIDLYIVHMDAECDSLDLVARWSQWSQLASMILTSNNGNPIIVMGDTNSRYTRDKIIDNFIGPLEEDARFCVTDAWVEKEYDGVYPEFGTDALMVHTLGYQKGEVVDKVLYINNIASAYTISANYYLQDTSFVDSVGSPLADHWPIVVEFTYEKRSYNPGTYNTNAANINWQGENPTAGGRYYIYHPETHTFLGNNDTELTAVTEPFYSWTMTPVSQNGDYTTMTMHSGAYYFNLKKSGVFSTSATPTLSADYQTTEITPSGTNTERSAYKICRTASPQRYLNYGSSFSGAQNMGVQNDWLFVSVQQFRDSMRTFAQWERTICSNEGMTESPFVGLNEPGVYTGTIVNHLGYDSVVTLTLHVLPAYEYSEEHTLNMGDSILFRGTMFHATAEGTFHLSDPYQTIHDCDSIYYATITVVDNTTTGISDGPNGSALSNTQKIFLNGQLYIRRDDVLYDPTGRRICTVKE
ncbi:MAG: hypothetical protein IKN59_04555 [Paludibacteraceae bacterium]|nr:hypothetical protein [Paludibacteraceae bacterium]